jgi:hypothetical protein
MCSRSRIRSPFHAVIACSPTSCPWSPPLQISRSTTLSGLNDLLVKETGLNRAEFKMSDLRLKAAGNSASYSAIDSDDALQLAIERASRKLVLYAWPREEPPPPPPAKPVRLGRLRPWRSWWTRPRTCLAGQTTRMSRWGAFLLGGNTGGGHRQMQWFYWLLSVASCSTRA